MGIKNKQRINMKAQMFSLTALIFVMLMVLTLFVFVLMGIGYDNLSEASTLSSSSADYGQILSQSASAFAYSSGSSALYTLFKYEYSPSLRQSNFVSNLSEYMQYLMVNGTLPNVKYDSYQYFTISSLMNQQTFSSYNAEIDGITGFSSKQITLNETKPQIFQSSPYLINIRYTENAKINTSSGLYTYSIPVNVSISINNTPDIFYAEQGIFKTMQFSKLSGLTSIIGSDYATSGNTVGFVYGSIIPIPSGATNCNAVPTALQSPPYNKEIILATSNAFGITNPTYGSCANTYGGLITQNIDTNSPPSIPYLVFPPSSNVIPLLQADQQELIYGPSLTVMNISNLIGAVSSESYFVSPFATSYSDRVTGNFQRQSTYGIFTFSIFDRQVAHFDGFSSITTGMQPSNLVGYTVAAWVNPSTQTGIIENTNGQGATEVGSSLTLGIGNPSGSDCANPAGTFYFGDNFNSGSNLAVSVKSSSQYPTNTWYFVVGTFNGVSGQAITPSQFNIYVNGNAIQTSPCGLSSTGTLPLTPSNPIAISPAAAYETSNFIGDIANMQIYNETLSPSQIYYLYQEGIEGIPISNSPLLGWYTLNGNPNDFSGNPSVASSTASGNVVYLLPSNYQRDTLLISPQVANTFPIPGILSCGNLAQCSNSWTPTLFMGNLPLQISDTGLSTAYFNGASSNIILNGVVPTSNVISASAWVNIQSFGAGSPQSIIFSGNFILSVGQIGSSGDDQGTYSINVNGANQVVTTGYQLNPNQWYLLAGTYGGNECGTAPCLSIYVNGQLTNTISISPPMPAQIPLNAQPTYIGYAYFSGIPTFWLNGTISNIQIYNSTLTKAQEAQLYIRGINGKALDTKHIVGWWPLDGDTNDYSGYGNYGYASGLSYRFIQTNYTVTYSQYNSIGLSTVSGITNEWQALGFPTPP